MGTLKLFLFHIILFQFINATGVSAQQDSCDAPGQLVDIGGYRLHIKCNDKKNTSPTVVLIHGAGGYSFDWTLVENNVTAFISICSYDRAGQAWSNPGPRPRGPITAAKELNILLERSNITPPYILAGHSWGGLVARAYQILFPKNVAGIILISSTHEDQYLWINGKILRPNSMNEEEWNTATKKKNKVVDTTNMDAILFTPPKPERLSSPYNKLPVYIQQQRICAMTKPVTKRILSGGDFEDFRLDYTQMSALSQKRNKALGKIPLIVISDVHQFDPDNEDGYSKEQFEWNAGLQKKLANLSKNSLHVITTKSTHNIHLDQPQLVAVAIEEMVKAVKIKKPISRSYRKLLRFTN